jgi:glycosyltransferase involved in cell wall biosynthesis
MPTILASAPLVIGMPLYNASSYVRGAIDSLLSQSFRDFVLFISDNASKDDTGQVCRDYALRDSRIVYFRQEANCGPVANFDFLLKNSSSEFFMWAADDDRWSPTHVERCVAALRADPAIGLAMSNVETIQHTDDGFVPVGRTVVLPSMSNRASKNVLIRFVDFASNLFYGVYRRRAIEEAFADPAMFDLFDLYVVNAVAVRWKIFISSDFSFQGGLRRRQSDTHRESSPAWLNYGPFMKRSLSLLFRELPQGQAALLSAVLTAKIGMYEAERVSARFLGRGTPDLRSTAVRRL